MIQKDVSYIVRIAVFKAEIGYVIAFEKKSANICEISGNL